MEHSLEIIYRDETFAAINKPHGLLVHKSPIAADASVFAVQLLRDQLGVRVYPVHRLDRKTGGVLLFALQPELNAILQVMFAERKIKKRYLAIVRGFTADSGEINYPLLNEETREVQEAFTSYKTLGRAEIEVPFGKHNTSRYSFVELTPLTGRRHQLRRHMAHIFHPIIGDRPHGCNKQNRLWKEKWAMTTMLLHASELIFGHPVTGQEIHIRADIQTEFRKALTLLNFQVFRNEPPTGKTAEPG
jgi:tRNA pseudouridine65 synthase